MYFRCLFRQSAELAPLVVLNWILGENASSTQLLRCVLSVFAHSHRAQRPSELLIFYFIKLYGCAEIHKWDSYECGYNCVGLLKISLIPILVNVQKSSIMSELREIFYVDKWFNQALPFSDFKCFYTSKSCFFPYTSNLNFWLEYLHLSPFPGQTLGYRRVHHRSLRPAGLKGKIASWMNTKLGVWLLSFTISQP